MHFLHFFSFSSKRTDKLKYFIDASVNSNLNKKKLKGFCETGWVDWHDIITTLKYFEYNDSNSDTFLVSLVVAVTCFSYILSLSQEL